MENDEPDSPQPNAPPRFRNAHGRGMIAWVGRDLATLLAAASAWSFAFSTFFLLPRFLVVELQASAEEIGILAGTFGLASVVLTPLAGIVAGRFGARIALLLGSVLIAGTAMAFPWVEEFGASLLGLRIIQALAHGLVFIAVNTAAVELSPPERLGQTLGFAGVSMLVMNAIGPAVVEPIAIAFGWPSVFALAGAVAVVAMGLSLRIPRHAGQGEAVPGRGRISRSLAVPYALIAFASGTTFGTVFAFEQPLALSLGRETVGGFFIAFAMAALIVRVGFGQVIDGWGRRRVAIASLSLYALATAALGVVGSQGLEVVGFFVGTAHGFFYPALNAMVLGEVSRKQRSRLLALFSASFNLGVTMTAALGLVAERWGYGSVFGMAGLASGLAVVVLANARAFGAKRSWRARTLGPIATPMSSLRSLPDQIK